MAPSFWCYCSYKARSKFWEVSFCNYRSISDRKQNLQFFIFLHHFFILRLVFSIAWLCEYFYYYVIVLSIHIINKHATNALRIFISLISCNWHQRHESLWLYWIFYRVLPLFWHIYPPFSYMSVKIVMSMIYA